MHIICLFLAFYTFGFVVTKPTHNQNYVVDFLSHYGYLAKELLGPNWNRNEKYIKDALSDFQNFSGINVTGVIDEDTMRMMHKPRCGVKDKVTSRKVSQFILKGGKWELPRLTFAILNYPPELPKTEVIDEITSAFNIWAKYTNLIFVRKDSWKNTNIKIIFANYSHGDGKENAFDGPGNVAGHAYPHNNALRGQLHLDITEDWTINSSDGVSLYQVVAHEIGHVLGIDHSMFDSSIMKNTYDYKESFRKDLSSDDIKAIQNLYGIKRVPATKPTKKMKKVKEEVICTRSPSQYYRYSQKTEKFEWEDENVLQKELDSFESGESASKASEFTYKLEQIVICKKFNSAV